MVRMPAGHLPSPPMEAARLFPEPAAGEPYTILIMGSLFYIHCLLNPIIGLTVHDIYLSVLFHLMRTQSPTKDDIFFRTYFKGTTRPLCNVELLEAENVSSSPT
jgi:hypothetical protein